jgi:hypothetical protein
MVSLQTRISRLPFATLIGWTVCTVALLAQTAQPPVFPNAPQGFDAPRQGIATGRVERVEYISSVTGGKKPAMVYTRAAHSGRRRLCGVPAALLDVTAARLSGHRHDLDPLKSHSRGPAGVRFAPPTANARVEVCALRRLYSTFAGACCQQP